MISSPGVEAVWHEPKWRDREIEAIALYVDAALGMAVDGMAGLDMPLQNSKQAHILKRTTSQINCEGVGLCIGPDNFSLSMDRRFRRRLNLSRVQGSLAVTAVHELTHCLRAGIFTNTSLAEHVIDEGLAYCAEGDFSRELAIVNAYEIPTVPCFNQTQANQLVQRFIDEHDGLGRPNVLSSESERAKRLWFEESFNGEAVGIIIVSTLLERDNIPYPELLCMPANEAIDRVREGIFD